MQLMVQGTTSDAGKSLLVAGLCRWLHRQGVMVAPFKPQNMALNSAVTADGGEIGRAQALQAQACGIDSHTDMNPVLLKPCSDTGAQIIIQGQAIGNMDATDYHHYKTVAKQAVLSSFSRLCERYDAVMVEGAGSPAEINLRQNDIANMGFAEAVDCPVILVADIDRGGVFAHLVGTLDLLSPSEQQRVTGFVINRFRGDVSLLQPGLDWLEQRTGKPVLGVIPYLKGLTLDAEDAVDAQQVMDTDKPVLNVVVPVLPRISNHTDFDPLRQHPQVNLQYWGEGQAIPPADLIILPGSKSVRADLQWLHQHGWQRVLEKHLRYGGKVLGICGGFQMLGQQISDPQGVESATGASGNNSTAGFGWLPMSTELKRHKQLQRVNGVLSVDGNTATCEGYEIHCGVSRIESLHHRPLVKLQHGGTDGILSEDGAVMGTYLHGLFDHPEAAALLLEWAGLQPDSDASGGRDFEVKAAVNVAVNVAENRERQLDRLADTLAQSLDMQALFPQLMSSPHHGESTAAGYESDESDESER